MRKFLLLILLAIGVQAVSNNAYANECRDIAIIFARGSGQNASNDPRELEPEEETFFDSIEANAELVGLTVKKSKLDYPAVPAGLPTTKNLSQEVQKAFNTIEAEWSATRDLGGNYRNSVTNGNANLKGQLKKEILACPEQKYILGGYSQGAHVVGDVIQELEPAILERITFVALFGDPKYKYDSYAAIGETQAINRSPQPILEARESDFPLAMQGKIASYCLPNDFICEGFGAWFGTSGRTPLSTSHDQYPAQHIPNAAARAIARYLYDESINLPPQMHQHLIKESSNGQLDVMFALDVSSSMHGALKQFSEDFSEYLAHLPPYEDVRVGLSTYCDHNTHNNVLLPLGVHTASAFSRAIKIAETCHGGDKKEGVNTGMMFAMNSQEWRYGASKMLIVIANGGMHEVDYVTGYTAEDVRRTALAIDPVEIYPLILGGGTQWRNGYRPLEQINDRMQQSALSPANFELFMAAYTNEPLVVVSPHQTSYVGVPTHFSAAGSVAPNEQITKYQWDWGNDGIYDFESPTPHATHTFTSAFDGFVTVRVVTESGLSKLGTPFVTVLDTPPPLATTVPPSSVELRQVGEAMQLQWAVPQDVPVAVLSMNGELLAVVPGTHNSMHFTNGLNHGQELQVQLVAIGQGGPSEPVASNRSIYQQVEPADVTSNNSPDIELIAASSVNSAVTRNTTQFESQKVTATSDDATPETAQAAPDAETNERPQEVAGFSEEHPPNSWWVWLLASGAMLLALLVSRRRAYARE